MGSTGDPTSFPRRLGRTTGNLWVEDVDTIVQIRRVHKSSPCNFRFAHSSSTCSIRDGYGLTRVLHRFHSSDDYD